MTHQWILHHYESENQIFTSLQCHKLDTTNHVMNRVALSLKRKEVSRVYTVTVVEKETSRTVQHSSGKFISDKLKRNYDLAQPTQAMIKYHNNIT